MNTVATLPNSMFGANFDAHAYHQEPVHFCRKKLMAMFFFLLREGGKPPFLNFGFNRHKEIASLQPLIPKGGS